MTTTLSEQIAGIKKAIESQEALRPALGDEVVDTVIGVLTQQLKELEAQSLKQDLPPEQRKWVTVLFADISGFTSMSEKMDVEDVMDLVNRLWTRLDKIIEEHGGRIDKHTGDNVMALWSVEASREDDPERAIHAALEMQRVVAENANKLPVRMRIGIHTGLAILSIVGTTSEYTAIGDTVNIANRLERAAPIGGILISHETYQNVRGVFDVNLATPLEIKGKSETIQTYEVERARPRAFRVGRRGVEGIETSMIGRDHELKTLEDLMYSVMRDSKLRTVTLTGDAGLGKSRLLHEFEAWLDVIPETVVFHKTRADEQSRSQPYSVMREILSFRFQILDSDTQAQAREKLEAGIVSTLGEGALEKAHFIGQLLGFDFSSSPELVGIANDARQIRGLAYQYLAQYFKKLSDDRKSPMMFLFDDLQWADNGSLEWIEYLANWEGGIPALIVFSARPALYEAHPQWGDNLPNHMLMTLSALSLEHSRELTEQILRNVPDLPNVLVDTIAANAEGNPFYLEELVKVLIEDGVIIKGADAWQVEPARLTQLRIPSTLTGVLQARLDHLPEAESEILQRAAVIGRTFWDAAIVALESSKGDSNESLKNALESLRTKELVFPHKPSAFSSAEEYIFKHTILREVTYERVLKAKRRIYHRSAAEWLVQQSGARVGEHFGLIAQHYELAGDLADAAAYLTRAGEQSLRVSAFRDALISFERALSIISTVEKNTDNLAQTAQLLLNIGTCHVWLTDYPNARARLEDCLELARASAEDKVICRALNSLGRLDLEKGDYDSCENLLAESLTASRKIGDREAEAQALVLLSYSNHYRGEYNNVSNHAGRSFDIARALGDKSAQAAALNVLAMSAVNLNDHKASRVYHLQNIEICKSINDRYGLLRSYANLSEDLRLVKEFPEAKEYSEKALKLCYEVGNRFSLPIILTNLSIAESALGEYEASRRHLVEGLKQTLANKAPTWQLFVLAGFAYLFGVQKNYSKAVEIATLILAHPETNSDVRRDAIIVMESLTEANVETELFEEANKRGALLKLEEVTQELIK